MTIHATTIAINGRGVMILGASGSGKSDLALRLIDRGATLVSDDYTILTRNGATLIASAPPTIAGRIEVRGLGIVPISHIDGIPVALAVWIGDSVPRMPDSQTEDFAGVPVRVLPIDPRPASAPLVVELALAHHLP